MTQKEEPALDSAARKGRVGSEEALGFCPEKSAGTDLGVVGGGKCLLHFDTSVSFSTLVSIQHFVGAHGHASM